MKINPSKSKEIRFTRARVKDPLNYSLMGTLIPEASSCKFYIHCSVHHCNCLKNNQHDVTCGLSFIFMGSRHSFSTCFELSGSSSSGDHFSLYRQPLV